MSIKIKDAIKKAYTNVVNSGLGCGCNPSCCESPNQDWTLSESYHNVKGYEKDADFGLGCGIPTEHAKLKKGSTVLDLGSGAGNDVFIARSIVGDMGYVIGIDMTKAMIEKANKNKQKLGYENVEFIHGEIENLPVQEESIDVVISNCVLNLVPDKSQAYSEVYRVLKPKAHFSMSDIVLDGKLPDGILQAAEMYAGCISGAMQKKEYIEIISKAGFKNITITKERAINIPDDIMLKYISEDELNKFKKSNNAIISLGVYAEK